MNKPQLISKLHLSFFELMERAKTEGVEEDDILETLHSCAQQSNLKTLPSLIETHWKQHEINSGFVLVNGEVVSWEI